MMFILEIHACCVVAQVYGGALNSTLLKRRGQKGAFYYIRVASIFYVLSTRLIVCVCVCDKESEIAKTMLLFKACLHIQTF